MRRMFFATVFVMSLPLCASCGRTAPARSAPVTASPTSASTSRTPASDKIRELQAAAIHQDYADWGYWGPYPTKYTGWTNHSNRLIPVYTFGIDLKSIAGEQSVYRDADRLKKLY